jgi:glutamate synthase (NADPH/NADH)
VIKSPAAFAIAKGNPWPTAGGRREKDMTSRDATGETSSEPAGQGLYDPAFEHDSCGVGFICDIKGRASHQIMRDANHINRCMTHRGGVGY